MKFLVNKPKYKIVKRFAWLPTIVRENKARTKKIKYWLRTYFAVYEYSCNEWKKIDFNTYWSERKLLTTVWQEIYVSNQLKNCQKVIANRKKNQYD